MGNIIFIQDRRVCIRSLRRRLETIQKLQLPTTVEVCRIFAGMVNFLSIFCPELQMLLKPIVMYGSIGVWYGYNIIYIIFIEHIVSTI